MGTSQAPRTRTKTGQGPNPARDSAEEAGFWPTLRTLPRSMGWLPFTTFVVSILGFADSGYQVYTHFAGVGPAGCSARSDSCVLVQSSQFAWIFGIPVAVYGVVFFAVMVALCSPPAWRSPMRQIRLARLAMVVIGILFVLYLIYREVVTLGQICEYCTSVHILTFALFALIVYWSSAPGALSANGPTRTR